MSLRWPSKNPGELLDYSVDWSRWLGSNKTIASVSWYIDDVDGTKVLFEDESTVAGLTKDSQTNTSTVATIYLDSGTSNYNYKIYCKITDSNGLSPERVIMLKIRAV